MNWLEDEEIIQRRITMRMSGKAHKRRLWGLIQAIGARLRKNDERIIYSRGLKTYFVSDILDEDIICPMGDEEQGFKYILADDFTCIRDGEIMGKVCPEVIEKMPKSN